MSADEGVPDRPQPTLRGRLTTEESVLPGGVVSLHRVDGEQPERGATLSNHLGAYCFYELEPGEYVISANLAGFDPQPDVAQIRGPAVSRLDIALELQSEEEEITVTCVLPIIDTNRSGTSFDSISHCDLDEAGG